MDMVRVGDIIYFDGWQKGRVVTADEAKSKWARVQLALGDGALAAAEDIDAAEVARLADDGCPWVDDYSEDSVAASVSDRYIDFSI